MGDVLNTMLKHDGEVVGQPGDKLTGDVKKALDEEFQPGESMEDMLRRTGGIVSDEVYKRLNDEETTAPVTVSAQGAPPGPEDEGKVVETTGTRVVVKDSKVKQS